IRPLLARHCYSCHSHEAKKLRGGLLLDSREGWSKGGESGPALIPGQPDQSLLVRAVRYGEELKMPPAGKLADRDIEQLVRWVRQGAPDPRTGPTAGDRAPQRADGQRHWAFQPLHVVPPPPVVEAGWGRTPVDRFVLAKLHEKGLHPNPEADRRTL